MKTRLKCTRLLWAMALIFVVSASAYAQTEHIVTLYVDTASITAETPEEEGTNFADFGQTDGSTNEEYLTDIELGDTIQWQGVAKNGTDKVHIERIIHVQGPNPFPGQQRELMGQGDPKMVRVVPATRTTEDQETDRGKYMIHFRIEKDGNLIARNFIIDPQLRVR